MAYRTPLVAFGLLLGAVARVVAQPAFQEPAAVAAIPSVTPWAPASVRMPAAASPGSLTASGYPVAQAQYTTVSDPGGPAPIPAQYGLPGGAGFLCDPGAAGAANVPPPVSNSLNYYGFVTPPGRDEPTVFFGADYLLWWVKAAPVVPLVTSSTDPADRAIIGNPTTSVLFGNHDSEYGASNGVRAHVDVWCSDFAGLELLGDFFTPQTRKFSVRSDANGNPTIGIPYFDPFLLAENAALFSGPGAQAGGVDVSQTVRMYGFEANFILQSNETWDFRWRLLLGGRYAHLSESLSTHTTTTFLADGIGSFGGNLVPAGTAVVGDDSFDTRNTFVGGQLGLELEWRRGCFFVNFRGKVALGDTRQNITVGGSSTATQPDGTTTTLPGNLLALPTNIGRVVSDEFTVLPEASLRCGVDLGEHVTLTAGYSFLYWSDVVRPGEQIDRNINTSFAPLFSPGLPVGPSVPALVGHHSEIWMHGLNAGLDIHW